MAKSPANLKPNSNAPKRTSGRTQPAHHSAMRKSQKSSRSSAPKDSSASGSSTSSGYSSSSAHSAKSGSSSTYNGSSSSSGASSRTSKSQSSKTSAHTRNRAQQKLEQRTINPFDCMGILVTCPTHNKIALRSSSVSTWLPVTSLPDNRSWINTARAAANLVLTDNNAKLLPIKYTKPRLIHWQRLGLPDVFKMVDCVIFECRLAEQSNSRGWKCCTDNSQIKWFSQTDTIAYKVRFLRGPEPAVLLPVANDKHPHIRMFEFDLKQATQFVPRNPEVLQQHQAQRRIHEKLTQEETLIGSSAFTKDDIKKLYGNYLQKCYPSFYMTVPSFVDQMVHYGYKASDTRLARMFIAFSNRNPNFLNFLEFQLGITAMEHVTPHNFATGPFRINYITKYYDSNEDGALTHDDIMHMTKDIIASTGQSGNLKAEADQRWKILENVRQKLKKNHVTNEVLRYAVFTRDPKLKFKGTSGLFRSEVNILQTLRGQALREEAAETSTVYDRASWRKVPGTCLSCRPSKLVFSPYLIHITQRGRAHTPELLTKYDPHLKLNYKNKRDVINYEANNVMNPKCIGNLILHSLREFDHNTFNQGHYPLHHFNKKTWQSSDDWTWIKDENVALQAIKELTEQVIPLLAAEPRIQKVQSPCYVIGDIHGNFHDLMVYERILWPLAPFLSTSNFLFLGDYVDRGAWGVEVVCYLFALKILMPDNIYMCRGNHEIRKINENYSFFRECQKKYPKHGEEIYELISHAFDHLPIAAVIDEAVFCCHGGIPYAEINLNKLQNIKCPVDDLQEECPVAWEITWNDPISENNIERFNELIRRGESSDGYYFNPIRNTAYIFDGRALDTFLQANRLTRVIRAHEVPMPGFAFQYHGKCITIFSSSRYTMRGNRTNTSACAFLDRDKLRIINLTTFQVDINQVLAQETHQNQQHHQKEHHK